MSQQQYLLKIDNTPDIQAALEFSGHKKFSGLITQIVCEENKRDLLDESIAEHKRCFTKSPLILNSQQWLGCIYPSLKINDDLNSSNDQVRQNYRLKLIQAINFMQHVKQIGYHYIQSSCNPDVLGEFLVSQISCPDMRIVVEIKLNSYRNYSKLYCKETENNEYDSWQYWNALHKASNYHNQIEVALVITSEMPENDVEIYRWLAEPVAMLVIPHMSFMTNKANFPVMSKKQQEVIRLFLQYQRCFIVIEPKSIHDHKIESYLDYIKHQNNFVDRYDHEEDKDSLRYPLQPLYDNLDSSTYETFERDPAKYILYQKAIEEALKKMISENEKATKKLIVLIVGAGRGPFIRAALNASHNTERKIKILVVEKNPNAIVTLSCLIRDLWPQKDIQLISRDMRNIQLDEKADILISELLGSFGDNELSPECLDGVQHLLKPTGVSIPSNSKSYLQPIMSKRTYGTIQKRKGLDGQSSREKYSENTEINWLIYLSNFFHIDVVKELFTFVHPNLENPINNSRYGKLSFETSVDCVLHGFCGYFSSKLYEDIEISIVPESHTQGMFSWYSAFFPIEKPIQMKAGDKIEVEFWRKLDATKVWYEWKVNAPEETIVHNLNGDIHPIYLINKN